MIKPNRLRAILTRTLSYFAKNPEALILQFDNGKIKVTGNKSPSFEYHYDLLVSVKDFPFHPDVLFVPIIDFIRIEQAELLYNNDNWGKVEFDIVDNNHKTYDIYISIPLTERVIARTENGEYQIQHGNEPQLDEYQPLTNFQIYLQQQREEIAELIFDSKQQGPHNE
ncbi:phage tail protein [Haemophilus sputorum]|uniref:Phage tail protein n=1 Tax=Haemophilus sputorum TaxID=1078480 RepID=A0A369YGV1_9PAST|nr:phage tail protein [Haemophilus sputorum]RDE73078.1 phage tail protein [Haemophilus sputorum]